MTLIASKREVEEVAALLEAGAPDARELAKVVIKRLSELREEREFQVLVFELSPGVYSGFGPFATKDAAFNSVDKNPVAYIAKKACIVPVNGPGLAKQMLAKADEPSAQRGEWLEIELDRQAFKRGWNGRAATRSRYLPAGS